MTLYNARSIPAASEFRITKFDDDLNPVASYITSTTTCDCPAGTRPTCRHRQMLPLFLHKAAIDTGWMLDYDAGPLNRYGWRQYVGPLEAAPAEAGKPITEAVERSLPQDPPTPPAGRLRQEAGAGANVETSAPAPTLWRRPL